MRHDSFNESAEMYLKTVAELSIGDHPVPISALAGRLGISAVSATEMVHKLQEHGLIDHRPYKGVILTGDGRRMAAAVIRSHRLWECFLSNHLGLLWSEVHDLACRLEHATDPQVTDALEAFLGYPATCPHGNPIPTSAGAIDETCVRPLTELQPSEVGIIRRIYPESRELLTYLSELGLETGVLITLCDVVPFQGPLVLESDSGRCYLGREAAAHLLIGPVVEEL